MTDDSNDDGDDDYSGDDNYGGENDHSDYGDDSPIQFILYKFLLQALKSSVENLGSTNQSRTCPGNALKCVIPGPLVLQDNSPNPGLFPVEFITFPQLSGWLIIISNRRVKTS